MTPKADTKTETKRVPLKIRCGIKQGGGIGGGK